MKTSNYWWDNYIYTLKDGRNNCGQSSDLWSRAISLLFCNKQDKKYESQEMENGVAGPIFIHENI